MSDKTLGIIHARMTRGCAGLYADPVCRKAVANAGAAMLSYVKVCWERYCALLRPKPAACKRPLKTASQRRAAWEALKEEILRRDLGPALLTRFKAASGEALQLPPRLERFEHVDCPPGCSRPWIFVPATCPGRRRSWCPA